MGKNVSPFPSSPNIWKIGLVLGLVSIFFMGSAYAGSISQTMSLELDSMPGIRHLSSLGFPYVQASNDEDDILENYTQYLRFVLRVGNSVDNRSAQILSRKFESLQRADPARAARFLRGLRFEVEQYRSLLGASRSRLHSQSPTMRRWVKKYIRLWAREADEHLFRAYASSLKQSNQAD